MCCKSSVVGYMEIIKYSLGSFGWRVLEDIVPPTKKMMINFD